MSESHFEIQGHLVVKSCELADGIPGFLSGHKMFTVVAEGSLGTTLTFQSRVAELPGTSIFCKLSDVPFD